MWKKMCSSLLSVFVFYVLALIGILSISTQTYAASIPECNPADIQNRTPIDTRKIDTSLCPQNTTCYTRPVGVLYDCYFVPPTGAVNFTQLQQALPGFNFTNKTVGDIVNELIPYLFGIAGLILLLYLIWGGFSLMLSKGDQKAVEAARGRITTAITGFVIIFVAYWLVQLLGLILGIEQFGQIFK